MFDIIISIICFFSVSYTIFSLYQKHQESNTDERNAKFYEPSITNLQYYYSGIYNVPSLGHFFNNVRSELQNLSTINTNHIKMGVYTSQQLDYLIYRAIYFETQSWLKLNLTDEQRAAFTAIQKESKAEMYKNAECSDCPFSSRISVANQMNEELLGSKPYTQRVLGGDCLHVKGLLKSLHDIDEDMPLYVKNEPTHGEGIYPLNKIEHYNTDNNTEPYIILGSDYKSIFH